jgi:hypothetical protein
MGRQAQSFLLNGSHASSIRLSAVSTKSTKAPLKVAPQAATDGHMGRF